ncbi:hypothetical protein [Bauldia sp.]|uniref:hypothetical protein n=1 Tax=Bauldia sp. TaxID=2575872 RepID=UPI003BAB57C9
MRQLRAPAAVIAIAALATPAVAADMAPRQAMVGMYSYLADAAVFTHCETEVRYPVAFEEEHILLERAYLEVIDEPGAELLVFIEARIEERPAMDGPGIEINVIPEKFVRVAAVEEDCTTIAMTDVEAISGPDPAPEAF